ncbi:MAG: hypothetical protein ACOYNC_10920 [Bacteroidales bacterium]
MLINCDENLRNELEFIISGKGQASPEDLIEATSGYLRTGKGTGSTAEQTKSTKNQETKELENFISRLFYKFANTQLVFPRYNILSFSPV